jgi:hypothetical protein
MAVLKDPGRGRIRPASSLPHLLLDERHRQAEARRPLGDVERQLTQHLRRRAEAARGPTLVVYKPDLLRH